MIKYIKGDIHDEIKNLETNSIDFLYTNPPFGITHAKWDMPLDWDNLWLDIWRYAFYIYINKITNSKISLFC